jgi:hypothetical protein
MYYTVCINLIRTNNNCGVLYCMYQPDENVDKQVGNIQSHLSVANELHCDDVMPSII